MAKIILKETITAEDKQQILELSLNAEEAVLKLYKYVATNISDNGIVGPISSLKSKIAEFNLQLKYKADENMAPKPQIDDYDYNDDEPKFIEKNERLTPSLGEGIKKANVKRLDLRNEWGNLVESVQRQGFRRKLPAFEQFLNKLSNYSATLKEEYSRIKLENAIHKVRQLSESVESFDKSLISVHKWAAENNIQIIYK